MVEWRGILSDDEERESEKIQFKELLTTDKEDKNTKLPTSGIECQHTNVLNRHRELA